MGTSAKQLLSHQGQSTGYDLSAADIRDLQIAAMDERFQEQKDQIKLVAYRAGEHDLDHIRRLEDVVPLLLPHTAYKSYPESFLIDKRYDRLTKWLATVSALPTDQVNLDG